VVIIYLIIIMKQKINNWDIFFICNELNNLINNRIQNIYDYDTKSIYLKFSGNEKKYLLLNPLVSLFLLNKSPKKLKNFHLDSLQNYVNI
jgi:predicted ribosome quality control (RQC) complex YloA/Tae2 family protein